RPGLAQARPGRPTARRSAPGPAGHPRPDQAAQRPAGPPRNGRWPPRASAARRSPAHRRRRGHAAAAGRPRRPRARGGRASRRCSRARRCRCAGRARSRRRRCRRGAGRRCSRPSAAARGSRARTAGPPRGRSRRRSGARASRSGASARSGDRCQDRSQGRAPRRPRPTAQSRKCGTEAAGRREAGGANRTALESRAMAILVTGGAGYIGRWLANELVQAGHEVVAVDVQPPPGGMPPELPAGAVWVKGDVTDKQSVADAVKLKPLSAIVHLAGIVTMGCERDPDLCMRVNLGGTANLLEAARQNGVGTFVFASTISVYGPNVSQPMVEGKTPAEPLTWYGESKILAEQLGLYYNRRWGLDFRAARMAAIVGPSRIAGSGSATMYTSLILEKAALGEPYEIDVDPEAGTPVLYARDAAKGLAALATAPSAPRRIYHLSTGLAT